MVLLFWTSVGFCEGRRGIGVSETTAQSVFVSLPSVPDRVDRVEGVLADFWSGSAPRARGLLRAERLQVAGRWHPFPAEVFLFVSGTLPVERRADRGDRVSLVGRLKREDLPASSRDVALPWTRYRMSVKSALEVRRTGRTALSLFSIPNLFFHRTLPASRSRGEWFDRNVRGPLAALLLGRTAELDRGMVARYRRGGLYHLLVVSGLHVALAAGLVLGGLRRARVAGKRRDAFLLVSVFLFVLVGGANPPAVRAGIVIGIFLAARLFERPIPAAQALGLSALALFVADPRQVYSIGTVLTFAAVGGITLLTEPIRRRLPARPEALFSGVATSVAAQCATAPVVFWRFNYVAGGAWLTAPLAIPLSAALIALGGAILVLFAIGIPAGPLCSLFGLGSRLLELLADRAAGLAFLRPTPPLAGVATIGALTLAAAKAPARLRPPAAILAVALFLWLAFGPAPKGPLRGFSIEALDVGQGDSILVRWARHAFLVDGGGPFDVDAEDFGRTRLLPKLLDRGVTRLDAVLATHPHPDHALGLFSVAEELPVDRLWLSAGDDESDLFGRLRSAARTAGVPVEVLAAGGSFEWSGARLTVLHSGGPRRKVDSVNNQSVVALFERDGKRALLTGDAGAPTEQALLDRGRIVQVDVLKVGHHGSRTATSRLFVARARPRLALLSCGRENRFGHPAAETLRTLAALHVPVFRTDRLSDVRVDLLPAGTLVSWRGLE
ncbi:MAG: DNA internalization-related competence protein ComEC/Rec2 [Acidobacteria bacterium]|nr:MAG: DNA internalization-related competence protein ComEC/Rec2 [Acidobacteriota bacterium]